MSYGNMSFAEYDRWIRKRFDASGRGPISAHQVRTMYDIYRRNRRAEGKPDPDLPLTSRMSDQQQREAEYRHTELTSSIHITDEPVQWRTTNYNPVREAGPFNADEVIIHLDGNPLNNDPRNLKRISAREARENFHSIYPEVKKFWEDTQNEGFTIAEAMTMKAAVAVVRFSTTSTKYEYLVPEGTIIPEGELLYAVTFKGGDHIEDGHDMDVARVIEIKSITDAEYEGKLKWAVALFTATEYNNRIAKQKERERLIRQATKLAEDKNTLEKLTKLIGDSEEGKALLAKIAALDE